jgi:transcriptional regulator with XRE-family HTH domain
LTRTKTAPKKTAHPAPTTAPGLPLSHFGEYLKKNRIAFEDAAASLGASRSLISMLAYGRARPGARLMFEIEQWSGSKITMQSWFKQKKIAAAKKRRAA